MNQLNRHKNFFQRALVTFTLGPLTLLLIYLGGWFFFVPYAALLLVAVIEYAHLLKSLGWQIPIWLLMFMSIMFWLLPPDVHGQLIGTSLLESDPVGVLLASSLFLSFCYALWQYETRPEINAVASWSALVGGVLLIGWAGSHFFRLRGLEDIGAQWTAFAMLVAWSADSGGYVFGHSLGKHKLSPRLSPKKTVEGYLGGIFAGVLMGVLVALALDLAMNIVIVVGLLITILGPVGDLSISLLKRSAGVKDSGNILPGHGGALDRTDSLIWSVVIAYYAVLSLV